MVRWRFPALVDERLYCIFYRSGIMRSLRECIAGGWADEYDIFRNNKLLTFPLNIESVALVKNNPNFFTASRSSLHSYNLRIRDRNTLSQPRPRTSFHQSRSSTFCAPPALRLEQC